VIFVRYVGPLPLSFFIMLDFFPDHPAYFVPSYRLAFSKGGRPSRTVFFLSLKPLRARFKNDPSLFRLDKRLPVLEASPLRRWSCGRPFYISMRDSLFPEFGTPTSDGRFSLSKRRVLLLIPPVINHKSLIPPSFSLFSTHPILQTLFLPYARAVFPSV